MIDFIWDGTCDVFQLLPLQGHFLPTDQYHIARVSLIIQGADTLTFMHNFYINEVYHVILKFYSKFVSTHYIFHRTII
jgi:hypothetical protein